MLDVTLPPVPPIQRTEVDGVTTLWMDEPGPLVAALCFRVGRSDEPTPMSGVTHLVEHLALAGLGVQDYDHNGFVDGQQTVFTSVGRPDEVVRFLESAVAGIRDLPVGRILMERRILREEREQRGQSIGGALRWYRFGYAGQGRGLGPADDELALEWLGGDRVREWAARWFTRQNAILWLTGPVPPGLRLDLPDGPPPTMPSIETVPEVEFPAHMPWEGPAASLAFTATRSSAIHIAAGVAHRRARQQLRFDQGLVYDIDLDYEPITPDVAHITFGAECPDDRIRSVAEAMLGVLRTLAADGPTPKELEQEMTAYLRMHEDRDGRIGLLAMTAWDTLWGGSVRTAEEFLDERRGVDPAAATKALRAGLESLLVLAQCDPLDGLRQYPGWSRGRVDGREFGPGGFHLPGRKPKERLIVGPDGATLAVTPTEWLTVRYEDLVACIHDAPDMRTLLGRDGLRVTVPAELWKDGARAIEAIDRAVPRELIACAEHGVGGLEDPDAPGVAAGAAAS